MNSIHHLAPVASQRHLHAAGVTLIGREGLRWAHMGTRIHRCSHMHSIHSYSFSGMTTPPHIHIYTHLPLHVESHIYSFMYTVFTQLSHLIRVRAALLTCIHTHDSCTSSTSAHIVTAALGPSLRTRCRYGQDSQISASLSLGAPLSWPSLGYPSGSVWVRGPGPHRSHRTDAIPGTGFLRGCQCSPAFSKVRTYM